MDTALRLGVILVAIGVVFVLLFLNKYVVRKYWLPAVRDAAEDDPEE